MTKFPDLNVAKGLSLPLELAARTQCIFAQKGAGKTYTAMVQTEELLARGVQVCVLDPTGVWWGLQSSADGGRSEYEVLVMGGGHGDVPLEPDAGEIVANFLVDTGQSVVLDISQFESQAAQDRFALALATKLYRLKAHDKANIHVMMDEADQFCPLRPQKGQEKLLHAWDLIVRLGRSRGLGLTAISQRPAVVHTNIRNNVDLLTCLRVTGPHDFKALREWTGIHATAEQAREFLETVPTLADGEAFFWSPAWLKIFQRAKVRKKHTFDSSRTPRPGEEAVEPKARRVPDLTKLTEQIKASVARAKENDPAALRARLAEQARKIGELEREGTKARGHEGTKGKTEIKRVEVPVVREKDLARLEALQVKAEERAAKTMEKLAAIVNPLSELLHGERNEIIRLRQAVADAARAPVQPPAAVAIPREVRRVIAPPPRATKAPKDISGRDALPGPSGGSSTRSRSGRRSASRSRTTRPPRSRRATRPPAAPTSGRAGNCGPTD